LHFRQLKVPNPKTSGHIDSQKLPDYYDFAASNCFPQRQRIGSSYSGCGDGNQARKKVLWIVLLLEDSTPRMRVVSLMWMSSYQMAQEVLAAPFTWAKVSL
jgi:hypothetical protein